MLELVNQFGEVTENNLGDFFIKARKYSVDNRSISISNDKLRKDLTRRVSSNKGDADLMADIIYSTRIKLKHRGVKRINPNHKDWLQLKELSELCNQFAEEFGMGTRECYVWYVTNGTKKCSSSRGLLSKLINMYEPLAKQYEAYLTIERLTKSQKLVVEDIHDYYCNKVAAKTGMYTPYRDDLITYQVFIKVMEITERYNISGEDYIDSQFDALDWTGQFPQPNTLISEKSLHRLNQYLYKQGTTIPKVSPSDDFWDKLKE